MKPKLIVERAMDGELNWQDLPFRPPHCDPRILHLPEECEFCGEAELLQKEREDLGVSNTGHSNRDWPCPADKARSTESLNSWNGNVARTKEENEAYYQAFREEIAKYLQEE